jgi:hypothetical protein
LIDSHWRAAYAGAQTFTMKHLYDLIGNVFFSQEDDWHRRQNGKILFRVALLSLVMGAFLYWVLKHMNSGR